MVPNVLLDNMGQLSDSELRVMLAAVRQTIGYHREKMPMSNSWFIQKTGLSAQGVRNGVRKATSRKWLHQVGKGKRGVKVFGVNIVDQSNPSTELTSPTPDPSTELGGQHPDPSTRLTHLNKESFKERKDSKEKESSLPEAKDARDPFQDKNEAPTPEAFPMTGTGQWEIPRAIVKHETGLKVGVPPQYDTPIGPQPPRRGGSGWLIQDAVGFLLSNSNPQYLINYIHMFLGTCKKPGAFKDNQFSEQPFTPAEVVGFRCWLGMNYPNLTFKRPETLRQYGLEFRGHAEYEKRLDQGRRKLDSEIAPIIEETPPMPPPDPEKAAEIEKLVKQISAAFTPPQWGGDSHDRK